MDINEKIKQILNKGKRVNVIIAGTTCAGKTTLARKIWNTYWDKYPTSIVSQDDYFKNLSDIPRTREGYLTDSIEAFNIAEFKCFINQRFGDL